ncbi:MAG: endonuclease/exonuclease/phosphatase family protein [Clostridia bacterium]|nr:endonuclease/exonuclease/phosphatase family protein [Clostridia bacterium]
MQSKLKILTYNICHGVDFTDAKNPEFKRDWLNINLDNTARIIKEIDADIVGLNEVYNEGAGLLNKQPEVLAGKCGYNCHTFGESLHFGVNSFGNAFLSKYEVTKFDAYKVLTPIGDERREGENEYYEDRVLLRQVINFNGTPISVYVTHFGLNLLEQERMVSKITSLIDAETNEYVLMGDFNVEPDAPILAPIYDRMTSVSKAVNFTKKTFSTFNEEVQIDYIFVSKGLKPISFDRVDENASDHFPCVATVVIEK